MIIRPPDIPSAVGDSIIHDYFRRLNSWSYDALKNAIPKDEAVESILLLSPNQTVYKITITDAGALQATVVPLGSHP